ncbi:MAG: Mur ligase domain-containing protein, partial [Gammaproteobacteria bacterium]|nr:Mur ligase domain-containing protein [Gammaproteobacteria bacterium]
MTNITLTEIAELLNTELHGNDAVMTGSKIDSRQIESGDLFVALSGVNSDGHEFIEQAYQAGACAALVNRYIPSELPQLVVEDVTRAYGQIARFWRQKSHAKVVAVTGSNGKTTLKEMIASILSQCGKVLATKGNLNN